MADLKTDVLVIGAGAVGLNAAYYLRKEGADVTIVDRGAFGTGCSFGNAGLLPPSHLTPLAAPGVILRGLKWMLNPESPFYIKPRLNFEFISWLWSFRKYCTEEHVRRSIPLLRDLQVMSRDLTARIAKDERLDFEFQQQGLLMLHHDEGRAECVHLAEIGDAAGLTTRLLDPAGIRKIDPGLETTAHGGMYIQDDAHMEPAKFARMLAARLGAKGVKLLLDGGVTNITHRGDEITGVHTAQGMIRAREVVLASGAWTPLIARTLGLRIPIQPAKGYSITYPKPDNAPALPLLLTEAKVAVTPFRDELRYAGTLELAGWNLTINRRRVKAILKAVPRYLPKMGRPVQEKVWAGLRPCTPDGLPIVGRAPGYRNLTLAAGHAMQGIAMASVTGKLVSEIVTGLTPCIDMSQLLPERFHIGAPKSCALSS